MRITTLFCLVAICFTSCSGPSSKSSRLTVAGNSETKSVLQKELTNRHASLRLLLSDEITISTDPSGNGAKDYVVGFDRNSKKSIIKEKETDKIFFEGRASRQGDVWLLEHEVGDGSYKVTALQIKDNQVLGWGETESQWQKMDEIMEVDSMKSLIESEKGGCIVLKPEVKRISAAYSKIIGDAKGSAHIVSIGGGAKGQTQTISVVEDEIEEEDRSTVIRKISPNPASNYFELDLNTKGDHKIEVTNSSNSVVFSTDLNDNELVVDCSVFNNGDYKVTVKDASGKVLDSRSLTISR